MAIAETIPIAPAAVACSHCRADVPAGLIEPGEEHQFCCSGCRTVFDVLRSAGLDRYYALRGEGGAARAKVTDRGYEELDDPAFARAHARPGPDGLMRAELALEGVHCAACLWLVERLPVVCPGVVASRLEIRHARATIVWDPARTSLARAARVLDSMGYPSHPARGAGEREARRREDRRHIVRIGIAGAAAGNGMLVAFALYGGMFDAMEPAYRTLFRFLSMGFGLVSLLWPGMVFFRGAWAAIRTRTATLDIAIALGLGVGGLWGIANTFRGTGELYFDSLGVLVFLLLVGRWIQARQQRGAADSVELLFSLTPSNAVRVEEGVRRRIPIEALGPGDIVEVLAGESIPADGTVVAGESEIDASLLTGESCPALIRAGAPAAAGTVNLAAPIRVRVEATGEATRVGRLVQLVADGARRRAPIVRLADRIAGRFIAAVLAASLVTLVGWLFIDPARAPEHMAALLIVTCPCALGMATPLAMTVAIGRAARRGILIKGADALQALARPGTIVLDKTGTVTLGRLGLRGWSGDGEALRLAAALERGSSHPIARAIAGAGAGDLPDATDVRQVLGAGIEGVVAGRRVAVGSPAFILGEREPEPELAGAIAACLERGHTPIAIAVDGEPRGIAALADPPREGTDAAIRELRRLGWAVEILSGDHPRVAAHIGRELGVEAAACRGGVTPRGKLDHVRTCRGPVVMVGDGVNDAAALAGADVGIAVHAGAEASLAAADIYLAKPGIVPIIDLLGASRRTMGTIRACFAVSIVYNAAAGGLAMAGVINPLIAAILMPLSSFSVLTLATRAGRIGGGTCR